MSVTKIEEVYLYVAEGTENPAENIEAAAFMDHSSIPFTRLFYNSEANLEDVLMPINTWWMNRDDEHKLPELTKFPFLTYVEIHDDVPVRHSPVKYLQGIEAIKTFPEFYNSVMNK